MPFPKGKYIVLTLNLPKDILDDLREEARKKRISVSKVILGKLMAYIEKMKGEKSAR